MRWVEFNEDVIYETEGRNKGPRFEKGTRHELRDDIAERFVRRGVAEPVDGPSTKKKEPERTRLDNAAVIEIPRDYMKLSAQDAKDLAAKLADPAVTNRNDALEVIEAELAERAKG